MIHDKYMILMKNMVNIWYIINIEYDYFRITSSTSQGGGGSFKNMKPIGEVGCCESEMAEWTDWWTKALSLLSLSFSHNPFTYQPTHLPTYLSIYRSVYLPTYLSIDLSTYLTISLSFYLSIYLYICLSVYLSVYLQAWKRSYFATIPQFLQLTTSKTKQVCETSSIFELDNIKRLPQFSELTTSKMKQFCETSFKNGKCAELTASYKYVLRFFHSTCLKYCACREKVMRGHTEYCTCHAKSSSQNWRSDAPKCNCSQEISARTS